MPRAKKVVVTKDNVEEVTEKTREVLNDSQLSVYNDRLELVRTYSVEVHGENAKELAEQFVAKQASQGKVLVIK